MAFYQLAELHRLRGEFAKAEQAYRQAGRFGRRPQPGLAQLRLAQGQVDAAMAAIRTALDEAPNRLASGPSSGTSATSCQARRRLAHRRGGVRVRARDPLRGYLEPPIPPLPGVWVVSPKLPYPLPS